MSLGEDAEINRAILEQKDLADLTPEAQRREAQLFIEHMHDFITKHIQSLEEQPEEKAEFIRTVDDYKELTIENHNKKNPSTRAVWEELNNNVASLTEKLNQKS